MNTTSLRPLLALVPLSLAIACGGTTLPGETIDGGDAADTGDAGDAGDAGDTGDATDAGPFACGAMTCAADQICQRLQIEGGPVLLPDDAGVCPSGTENVGGHCQQPPHYACVATPSTCGATIDCGCAGDLCRLLSSCPYMCQGASGRELDCVCAVP